MEKVLIRCTVALVMTIVSCTAWLSHEIYHAGPDYEKHMEDIVAELGAVADNTAEMTKKRF